MNGGGPWTGIMGGSRGGTGDPDPPPPPPRNCQIINFCHVEIFRQTPSRNLDPPPLRKFSGSAHGNEYIAAILMDLSKAFDCLPPNLIKAKLIAHGLSEEAVILVDSYLSDRKQCVKNFRKMQLSFKHYQGCTPRTQGGGYSQFLWIHRLGPSFYPQTQKITEIC